MRRAGIVMVVWALTTSCVGPSRTTSDYQRKAAESAESMISVAESALLTAELAVADKAPGRFVSLRMSESEDAAEWIITSFSAVQPPTEEADELREDLLRVLDEVGAVITESRIAAYRGEIERLGTIAAPLEELSRRLEEFKELGET